MRMVWTKEFQSPIRVIGRKNDTQHRFKILQNLIVLGEKGPNGELDMIL